MDKSNELGTEPVGKLLFKYSVPAVTAMLVNAIYNIVDRIFISFYVGEDALGGLTVVFPIMMLIFAISSLVGIGGTALMSIRIGENKIDGAERIFGNAISLGFIIYFIILLITLPFLDFILPRIGGSESLNTYAKSYIIIILIGFVAQMFSFILSSAIRIQNNPTLPMIIMIVSAVTNIILDYVFIAIFNMGVEGAALATVIGQSFGLIIAISFFVKKKSIIVPRKKYLPLKKYIVLNIFSIGFASFVATLGTSLSMVLFNKSLKEYGGDNAVIAMGAINSIFTFYIMPINGIQQSVQPIIGYNFGAKNMNRVFRALVLAIGFGIVFSIIAILLFNIMPTRLLSLFIKPTSSSMGIAVEGLRIFTSMLPLVSINLLGVAFFQSINQGKKSMILSLLRQFLILIPAIILLPKILGLTGVWIATPLADFLSTIIVIYSLLKEVNKYKKKEY